VIYIPVITQLKSYIIKSFFFINSAASCAFFNGAGSYFVMIAVSEAVMARSNTQITVISVLQSESNIQRDLQPAYIHNDDSMNPNHHDSNTSDFHCANIIFELFARDLTSFEQYTHALDQQNMLKCAMVLGDYDSISINDDSYSDGSEFFDNSTTAVIHDIDFYIYPYAFRITIITGVLSLHRDNYTNGTFIDFENATNIYVIAKYGSVIFEASNMIFMSLKAISLFAMNNYIIVGNDVALASFRAPGCFENVYGRSSAFHSVSYHAALEIIMYFFRYNITPVFSAIYISVLSDTDAISAYDYLCCLMRATKSFIVSILTSSIGAVYIFAKANKDASRSTGIEVSAFVGGNDNNIFIYTSSKIGIGANPEVGYVLTNCSSDCDIMNIYDSDNCDVFKCHFGHSVIFSSSDVFDIHAYITSIFRLQVFFY
jgi:hypothetical protein